MPRRRPGLTFVVAAILVLASLAGFAVALTGAQNKARGDVERRFRERADVSAALTSSLFASTSSNPDTVRPISGATVSPAQLDAIAKRGHYLYAVVLDARGRELAASTGTRRSTIAQLERGPAHVRGPLTGARFGLSRLQTIPGTGRRVLEYVTPFRTARGVRLLVSGFPPVLISSFLSSYLSSLPNTEGANAYVLDSAGNVIGSTSHSQAAAAKVDEAGLLAALARHSEGPFTSDGQDRYLTSARVDGAAWDVVLTASTKDLYASVEGSRKFVPWLVFVGFAVAAGLALLLLRGLLRGARELARANTDLANTNARVERANAALEERAAELARSNADLQEFASIASHDLQEPLRKVQFFGDQIAERHKDELSPEVLDNLSRMQNAARRMRALTDDLLMFSRVSTRGTPFTPVDLRQVTDEVLSDLEQTVEESGGTVEVGELPTIDADPVQMRQMLQNLLANALKFARESVPPEVRVSASVAHGRCDLVVADNGIGFDPKYGERIFRIFERLHGRSEYAGTGIGLALCRKIAERHGGTISASGVPGEGATFTVTLPVRQPAAAGRQPRPDEAKAMTHA